MPHHEQGMENWRNEFQNLDWSRGWSREDFQQRFPNIPSNFWERIPAGRKFYSFNEFWSVAQPTGTGAMGGPMPGQMGGQGPMGGPSSTGGSGRSGTERGGYGETGR
jgi:hypothetical protein